MDKNRWKLQEAETKVLQSIAAEGDLNSTRYSVLVKYDRRRENRAHRFKSYPVISSHVKEQPNWRRGNKKRSKTSNVFTGSQSRSQLSRTSSVVVTLTTSDVQVLSAPIIFNNGCGFLYVCDHNSLYWFAAVPINNQHQRGFLPEKWILNYFDSGLKGQT